MEKQLNGCAVLSDFGGFGTIVWLFYNTEALHNMDAKNEEI